jgi:diguanylate cyclase (GGDEF)-like protein
MKDVNKALTDRVDANTVSQALLLKGWHLAFPRALEDQYMCDQLERRVRYAIRTAFFALVVYNIFLLVDWLLMRDVFDLALILRLGIYTPVSLLLMGLFHRHGVALAHRVGTWTVDWVTMVTTWFAALTVAVILLMSHSPHAHLYHAGFVVVLVYGNLLQRIRFRVAAVFSLGVMALHGAVMLAVGGYPSALRVPMVLMVAFSAASTLAFNYELERQNRRRYLLSLQETDLLAELKSAHAELILLSQTDETTGLANRSAMDEYLKQVWVAAQQEPQAVSLLLIEVDQLRGGVLQLDRNAMDRCVREIAQVLVTSVRPKDLMVRFDAQTFAALLPDVENVEAMVAADRLIDAVRSLELVLPGVHGDEPVTVSIGVATATPADPQSSPQALVARGQRALARATVAGRDLVSN